MCLVWAYALSHSGSDAAEVSLLIKVFTLICDAPTDLAEKNLPQHADELVEEGRQLRAQRLCMQREYYNIQATESW
jgi:hypothetical protein